MNIEFDPPNTPETTSHEPAVSRSEVSADQTEIISVREGATTKAMGGVGIDAAVSTYQLPELRPGEESEAHSRILNPDDPHDWDM